MTGVFDEFNWRGLVFDHTEGVPQVLAEEKIGVYIGFDPTSTSLQVGNLLALMGLARLQRYGHHPIVLAGGGTGMIGDPSGKSQERNLLTLDQVAANVERIKEQLVRFLDFEVQSNPARLVNNADWLTKLSLMEFLRDTGKHFTVNYMLAKDSVKSRVEKEEGISYTEFTYMLLQSYDFMHLYQHYDCRMQAGGSDQWGNITAGVELIRRRLGGRAYGMVYPLVTNADGAKLGKTERGTVWLDPERTSPYRFYQFWFNQPDSVVMDYLRYFTWFDRGEIAELEQTVIDRPEQREAQRTLAQVLTRMVHGETELSRAETASAVLFGGEIAGLSARDIADIFADVPSCELPAAQLAGEGLLLVDLLAETNLVRSKGEARRLVQGGGVYLNNVRATDQEQVVTTVDAIEGRYIVLRKGKRAYHLVQLLG